MRVFEQYREVQRAPNGSGSGAGPQRSLLDPLVGHLLNAPRGIPPADQYHTMEAALDRTPRTYSCMKSSVPRFPQRPPTPPNIAMQILQQRMADREESSARKRGGRVLDLHGTIVDSVRRAAAAERRTRPPPRPQGAVRYGSGLELALDGAEAPEQPRVELRPLRQRRRRRPRRRDTDSASPQARVRSVSPSGEVREVSRAELALASVARAESFAKTGSAEELVPAHLRGLSMPPAKPKRLHYTSPPPAHAGSSSAAGASREASPAPRRRRSGGPRRGIDASKLQQGPVRLDPLPAASKSSRGSRSKAANAKGSILAPAQPGITATAAASGQPQFVMQFNPFGASAVADSAAALKEIDRRSRQGARSRASNSSGGSGGGGGGGGAVGGGGEQGPDPWVERASRKGRYKRPLSRGVEMKVQDRRQAREAELS